MFDLSKLNICFVVGTLGQGGAERQLYYTVRTLSEEGARVGVFCLSEGEFWESRIRKLGIPVAQFGRRSNRLMRLSYLISAISKEPPDILQSQHFYTNLYVVAAARILRLSEIGALRSDAVLDTQQMGELSGALGLKLPKFIVANSQAAIQNAIAARVSPSRLHHLPNVVDTDRFSPAGREVRTTVELLAAGRLVDVKRYDRLLRVISKVKKKTRILFRLRIAGDGPLRFTLERQAEELGLTPGVVEFIGPVSDLADIYKQSDVVLLTSDREGSPNVLLEAMATGLPVVASSIGGIPEIVVHGKTGYLIDRNDEEGITHAICRLLEQPCLRDEMGNEARNLVYARHALSQLPEHLVSLYEKVLSGV